MRGRAGIQNFHSAGCIARNTTVGKVLSALALPDRCDGGPDRGGSALGRVQHLRAHFLIALPRVHQLVGQIGSQTSPDAARVQGEGVDAARPKRAVEVAGGPDVGRLGLAVAKPRVVRVGLVEVVVVKVDGGHAVSRGGDVDDARVEGGRRAGDERGEEEAGEEVVREVVDCELALEAVLGLGVWACHDSWAHCQ